MISIVRTIYSGDLQNSLLLGIPYATKKYSTLNEFLGIAADVSLATTDTPKMRYAAIGNGGHKMVVGSNGIAKIEPIQHTTTDAALYNQIPFVLRAIGNDLSLADQANYGLKKRITVGVGAASADYYAYYLKRLDFTSVVSKIQLMAVANGVTTTTDYVPTASNNLNMTPPNLSNTGVNVTTGNYVTASAQIPFTLNANDVAEILSACTIIFGDPGYAIISEVALCTGVDKNVMFESSGFNEVIGCQVMTFTNTFYPMNVANFGVDVILSVGSGEPLISFTTTP